MKRSFSVMVVFAALMLFAVAGLHAASFYEGKVVRITIGTTPGGGYDAWGRLAMESGEVGGGAPSWDSAKTSWKSLIDRGEASIFALGAPRRLREIPDVPTATEYARTEEEKRILEVVINSMNEYSRPFVLPPGTPRDRVQILRKAFEDMIKDPEFMAEVEKMKVTLDPASAEELTSAVGTLAKIDSALLARLKTILFE